MNIDPFLANFFGIPTPRRFNPENWTQVGKLTKEEALSRRTLNAKADTIFREINALESKIHALQASLKADADEWWVMLYAEHGLPRGNYFVMDDGRIMLEPKKEEK